MSKTVDAIGSGIGIALLVLGVVALLAYLIRGRARAAAALLAVPAMVVVGPMTAAGQSEVVPQVTETNPTFELIPSDLEFILDQIQISEAHAYAQFGPVVDDTYTLLCDSPSDTSGKCVPDISLPYGLRTVDGSFNNLLEGNERIGAGNEVMPRLLPIEWREGDVPPPMSPPNPPGVSDICPTPGTTCYEQTDANAFVYDADPRVISNLIVDNSIDNPAAVDAAADNPGSVILPDGDVYLPNIMADEGLSAPVNLWFVFFGQFFDHGLDMVNKGGSGTIVVPLNPDDPLYVPGSPTNFMMLTRATNGPGPDGIIGTDDDEREHENRTTPWVDQNQTYTSHPAHQVFLREYELVGGAPQATGRLLNGADIDGDGLGDGLATWNDVKAQANDVLGINLTDDDVLAVPTVYVDYYGNFIPDGAGMPQLVTETGMVSGNLDNPVDTTPAINLNQAFLDDIAHGAVPLETEDPELCPEGPPCLAGYDNVLLGEHFITGDGRGNENIG
ncbi:peroxidase family protein, partial [Ilumatobacter sp.]|uniref:peroxidase family protein n=1 Tax=Ilumatobacter sp. TaxID=1967498 RepID=UPI003C31B2DF